MQFPIATFLDPETNLKRCKKQLLRAAIFTILLKLISSNPPTIPESVKITTVYDALLHYVLTVGLQASCGAMAVITLYLFLMRLHLAVEEVAAECDDYAKTMLENLTEDEKNFSTAKDSFNGLVKILAATIKGKKSHQRSHSTTPAEESFKRGSNIATTTMQVIIGNIVPLVPVVTAVFAIYLCRTDILNLLARIQSLL